MSIESHDSFRSSKARLLGVNNYYSLDALLKSGDAKSSLLVSSSVQLTDGSESLLADCATEQKII